MDDLDKDILELLQVGDYCIPQNTKIAEKLGKPISSVRERTKKMREGGLVLKYVPLLDFSRLGWNTTSVVLVKAKQGADVQKLIAGLEGIPGAQEVFWVEGGWNIFLKLRTRDEKGLEEIERSRLLKLEGVKDFKVVRVSTIYKEEPSIPLS